VAGRYQAPGSAGTWLGEIGVAGMFIGAFAPWVSVFGFGVNAIQLSCDGRLVLGVAALAGLSFLAHARGGGQGWPGLALLSAIGGGAMAYYDRQQIQEAVAGAPAGFISVGWGLNLTLIASALVAVTSLFLMFRRPGQARRELPSLPRFERRSLPREEPSTAPAVRYEPASAPVAPAGWYADPYGAAPWRYWSGETWTAYTHDGVPQAIAQSPDRLSA
jgi:hypothetical protein